MKLHQIIINEMTGPVSYELTLGEIIKDGDTSNHYQIFILSLLSRFFNSGATSGLLDGPIPISSDATSVSAIEAIKSLPPNEKVNLAKYLLHAVQVSQATIHNTPFSSADWIQYVLLRQDD